MIIYEITARVPKDLVEEFESFMQDEHIPDLLATGHFSRAEMACFPENCYRIRYEALDKTALDDYLAGDAERLRRDFLRRFPTGAVKLSREILAVIGVWEAGQPTL